MRVRIHIPAHGLPCCIFLRLCLWICDVAQIQTKCGAGSLRSGPAPDPAPGVKVALRVHVFLNVLRTSKPVTCVVEPEIFAGGGVVKNAPAPGCCCVTYGFCGGGVATVLIICTQIYLKKLPTLLKSRTTLLFFKTFFLYLNLCLKKVPWSRPHEPEPVKIGPAPLHWSQNKPQVPVPVIWSPKSWYCWSKQADKHWQWFIDCKLSFFHLS